MGWWFGRKAAPDARPFAPDWLRTREGEGFALSRDGMRVDVVSSGKTAVYRGGAWDVGTLNGSQLVVDGLKVVGSRGSAIEAPAGGSTVDSEARTAIGLILDGLRQHGLIEM
ncbi:hypothetical protein [Sphingomonas sp.]|uniref:hypothetical protein n=1 Tax=Sphingomonas sp. TaxID=28214 RepID=UPI00286D37EB|nr:hypothetical protein [Sphingomonas sp.]